MAEIIYHRPKHNPAQERVLIACASDFNSKAQVRCAEYAFGIRLQEPWCFENGRMEFPKAFFRKNPIKILQKHGYKIVGKVKIKKNDVVFYYRQGRKRGKKNFKHVGVVTENLKVISKFGECDVWEHSLWNVDRDYGNKVILLRKDTNFKNKS